jgi:1-acyl-sn-glycerol-3-phosphate acyltransferase
MLVTLFDLTVDGADHLLPHGPYIVAANHHNYLDGVVLAAAVPAPISFLVMPRVWNATPLHPLFHRHIGSIPLTLDGPDVGGLRAALAALDAGRVIGIFPEGPFSRHGRLEAGLHGVALLALRSGVPVIPVAISGTYEALAGRRWYIPRRQPLRVRIGPPHQFARQHGEPARDTRAAATERIMSEIRALLA